MKLSKFSCIVSVAVVLILSFSACKKDKASVAGNVVSKDKLLGKWNMNVVLPGGFIEKDQVTLKTGGVMEMDIEPSDGITDFILSWDEKDNDFTAHLDLNGVNNAWKLNAQVDPKTLFITGEKIMGEGGNNPLTVAFSMEKQ